MRYWHPFAEEVAADVRAFEADEVILLPMYPQYSTTTSASSIADFKRAATKAGVTVPIKEVCCYPVEKGFIEAQANLARPALEEAKGYGKPRVLFSAHGLPKKVVGKGDPYQWQVEQSAAAIAEEMGEEDLDWRVCYQSRVGPLEWIGPATEDELRRAGSDGVSVVLVPLAFVSEHSETMVELDIEYRKISEDAGVPRYIRVSTVLDHPAFIGGLAEVVRRVRRDGEKICSGSGERICPGTWRKCGQA